MDDCIFCKIIRGEIQSYKIYEDKVFIVFLDINPCEKGHVLIIPKSHFENIFDLPEGIASDVLKLGKRVAISIQKALKPTGFKFIQNNGKSADQVIGHYHMHIIPKYDKQYDEVEKKNFEEIKKRIISALN